MLQIHNETPFESEIFVLPDQQGVDTLFVVVKATFEIAGRSVRVAARQQPVVMANEHWGEPGQSSLKYPSEVHLTKPATDVILVGSVYAPNARAAQQCTASVRVGTLQKVIQVFGDRIWRTGIGGLGMSAPQPFLEMPLVYERAFGGVHDRGDGRPLYDPKNPVGRGFRGARSASELEGMPLPNLEDPRTPIREPSDVVPPAGFGAVAESWEPRRSFTGTYDDAWQSTRAPYLPLDFSPRFFNFAPPDLTARGYLRGGEPVEIANCSPGGMERFSLPVCSIQAEVDVSGTIETPVLALETVLLEPAELRLCLTYRGAVPCDKRALKVDEVHLTLAALQTGEGR